VAQKGKPRNTRLDEDTTQRVTLAMKAIGSTVYGEFVRTALVERCRKIEEELRREHPTEFERIYGKSKWGSM
jgi:hypothetical protein